MHGNALEANTTRERGQRAASSSAYSRARARSAVSATTSTGVPNSSASVVGAAAADAQHAVGVERAAGREEREQGVHAAQRRRRGVGRRRPPWRDLRRCARPRQRSRAPTCAARVWSLDDWTRTPARERITRGPAPVKRRHGGDAADAARDLRDPRVLPHQPDAGLLRLADRVQPARHRPLAAQLLLRQLLRLVRGQPPARVRPAASGPTASSSRWRTSATTSSATRRCSTASQRSGGAARRCSSCSTTRPRRPAAAAGLEVAHPSAELRHRLDSKIVTTQLGNEAGVPSAPNTLGRAHVLRRS